MPANTARLALPYPTPADTVDVPRDVQALAAKLDTITGIAPPIVTTLPATPVEGQEVYYAASPTVYWHLRYTGTVWMFLGGPPLFSSAGGVANGVGTANSDTYAEWANGPHLALKLPGIYVVDSSAVKVQHATGGTIAMQLRVGVNGANSGVAAGTVSVAQFTAFSVSLHDFNTVPADGVLSIRYSTSAGSTMTLGELGAYLSAYPFAIGAALSGHEAG